ncbi:LysM domain-containing protein [Modestobacter sp. DSM 44400]|uniref:LysM peptidoglycan-binding domain-containing protein n=1 Tax=Modestobacter sp. DSM 44400 TaxID=1550230 RepID=UPI00089DA2F8|nr:LysM peptidoglycan-binding domain-containing protein [Modestobacter sp. DSM 44400]SDX76252.1 LysM domain-containing protein [Modestobacter sp. DSM 44400]
MTSAEFSETPVPPPPPPPLPVRSAGARPLPGRPAARPDASTARGPQSAAPATARRDAVRPGARAGRHDGVAGARPVRGGCPSIPAGVARTARERYAGEATSAPLRLTRRGRRLVAALSVATGLTIASVLLVAEFDGAGPRLELAGQSSVVVQAGDTLWSIAREVAPEEDVRAVVDAIEDANDLGGTLLAPGQVLQLP